MKRVTGVWIKAARALLGWTTWDLAEAAGISPESVRWIEQAEAVSQDPDAQRILNALERAGIEYLAETERKGIGLRLRSDVGPTAKRVRRRGHHGPPSQKRAKGRNHR